MALSRTIRLANGVEMPRLGLGVYKMRPGPTTQKAVAKALELGYRMIDTARLYDNERDVGAAIRESGLPRRDIFVTTKLRNADQGYDSSLKAFDASLERLGLDDVDLYLIHFPVTATRRDSWRALEKIAASGRARAIGVSNYQVPHLEELFADSKTVPAVDQVELNPFLYQRDVIDCCATHHIVVEAYAPLTAGDKIDDPRLLAVAKRVGHSVAQVLLRWCLQRNLVVIPKATSEAHLRDNLASLDFTLSEADMVALDALDEGYRSSWDPSDVP